MKKFLLIAVLLILAYCKESKFNGDLRIDFDVENFHNLPARKNKISKISSIPED